MWAGYFDIDYFLFIPTNTYKKQQPPHVGLQSTFGRALINYAFAVRVYTLYVFLTHYLATPSHFAARSWKKHTRAHIHI